MCLTKPSSIFFYSSWFLQKAEKMKFLNSKSKYELKFLVFFMQNNCWWRFSSKVSLPTIPVIHNFPTFLFVNNIHERSWTFRSFVNVHNHSQSFVNVRERSWMIIHNHLWTFILIPGTFINVRLIFLYLKLIKSS